MASKFSMRREYPALSALFFSTFLVVGFLIVTQFVGVVFDEPRFETWALRGFCVLLGAMVIYQRFRAMKWENEASAPSAQTEDLTKRG